MRPLPFLLVAMLALGSCVANIPDGRFSCLDDAGCPSGFTCTAGLCRRGAPECTVAADCDDGQYCNGDEVCRMGACVAGTSACTLGACIEADMRCEIPGETVPVRFVQADPRAAGDVSFEISGTAVATLAYGRTSGAVEVPEGSVTIEARTTTALVATLTFTLSGPSVVVLRLDAAAMHAFTVLPDDLPPRTASALTVRFVDATLGPAEAYNIAFQEAGRPILAQLPRGSTSSARTVVPGSRSLGLMRNDAAELELIAFFPQVTVEASAYVLLAGDTERHLGAPDGPRAIVVTAAGAAPIASAALVFVLNATSDGDATDGTRIFTCVTGSPGAVEVGIAARDLLDADGAERGGPGASIGISATAGGACDSLLRVPVGALDPARRHLIVVGGTAATLRANIVSEPGYDSGWVDDEIGARFSHHAPELMPGPIDIRVRDVGFIVATALPLFGVADLRIAASIAAGGGLDVVGTDADGNERTLGPFQPPLELVDDQAFVLFTHLDADIACTADAECVAPLDVCMTGGCRDPRLLFVFAPYGAALRVAPPR